MSVITISFYNGETGEVANVPSDFKVLLYPPGSEHPHEVTPIESVGGKFVATTEPGVFTIHFGSEEKIVSLNPQVPGDVALVALEGHEARAYFNLYLWNIQPDSRIGVPILEVPTGPIPSGGFQYTCQYCMDRYMTPSSPYFQNATWYKSCCTIPPCT